MADHFNVLDVPQAGGSESWEFDVTSSPYSADPTNTSDSTPAFVAAVADAFAYAAASPSGLAIIDIPEGHYKAAGALIAGGATKGNAQIPIPLNLGTDRKVTLVLRGPHFAGAMPYWEQSAGNNQRWGATIETTLTGQTVSGAWGVPSVIGGPAVSGSSAEYGSSGAKYNNVCIVLDGLGIVNPINPSLGGFEFRGMAQFAVTDHGASVMAAGSPTQLNTTRPDKDWSFGFALPQNFNNDLNYLGLVSVYGQYTGLIMGEHAYVGRAACIYCNDGVFVQATSENIHASAFVQLSVEACVNGITASTGDSYGAPIHVASVSFETITGNHIQDPSSALAGYINITKLDGPTGLAINGGAHVEIINSNQDRGAIAAVSSPAIPASTVALVNPYWRHAAVSVVGGTVTAITVDGVATGLTAGTVMVPSGKSIAITYSVVPTSWRWQIL